MDEKNSKQNPISVEDVLYFLGLASFFAGIWLGWGLPYALTATGATLMLTVAYLMRAAGSQ